MASSINRPGRLSAELAWCSVATACVTAFGLWLWTAAVITPWWVDYLVAVLPLCAVLFLIRIAYPSGASYLFSAGFWLSTTIFFYILLKSADLIFHDVDLDGVNEVIWAVSLFALAYVISYKKVQTVLVARAATRAAGPDAFVPEKSRIWLLVVFGMFKLFGVFLSAGVGGNALEVSAATQNNGAAYLYKIPMASNAILLFFLFDALKNNRGKGMAFIAIGIFLIEAVIATNRLSLVMATLWTAFLYHRYRKPIRLGTVTLIGLPLVFIVVLLGYARNIEVGSLDAYAEAFSFLMENPVLLSDLFMSRMDMLPEMVEAFALYHGNELPSLYGSSYVYTFLHAVPRNIWEAKPLLTAALVTAQTHPGAFADGVNIFPSVIVEALINLSWIGIALAGALVGMLAAGYEKALYSDRAIPTTWALASFTFPMALFNEGFHSNFSANLMYVTALMFVMLMVFTKLGIVKLRRTV